MKSPIEISNGRDSVKIYQVTSRGRSFFQLSYCRAGLRERRTFSDKDAAKREAKTILCQLASNAVTVQEAVSTTDIESLVAARSALNGIPLPLHLVVEGFAGAMRDMGMPEDPMASLHRAVAFYVKHHPAGSARVKLVQMTQRYIEWRKRIGLSNARVNSVSVAMRAMLSRFSPNDTDLPAGREVAA